MFNAVLISVDKHDVENVRAFQQIDMAKEHEGCLKCIQQPDVADCQGSPVRVLRAGVRSPNVGVRSQ